MSNTYTTQAVQPGADIEALLNALVDAADSDSLTLIHLNAIIKLVASTMKREKDADAACTLDHVAGQIDALCDVIEKRPAELAKRFGGADHG